MKTLCVVLALTLSLLNPLLARAAVTQQISERTYQQLSQAHNLMQKQRYDGALAQLDRLRPRVTHRRAELALVLQTYGHLYAALDKYPQAITALSECLALEALPRPATARTLYLLTQLQMVVTDYAGAVSSVEKWLKLQRDPAPAGRALAGTAYAGAQRYTEATRQLRLAIQHAERPEEDWYRQLLAVHYQSGQYAQAAGLLHRMILLFPERKAYWLQLSGVYSESGDHTQSLAVLELAYLQGLLTEERELLNLAQHYLYTGLAHKAGELLEDSLRKGALARTQANWNLLIDAWLHARETSRALAAVERALESVEHAELHLRHAQLLADREDWPGVMDATGRALAGDGLTAPGKAHLLAGMAQFHLQRPQQAQSRFERAREFDHSRQQAEQWLQHLAATQVYEKQVSALHLSP